VLLNQPNGPLPRLLGVLLYLAHDPILLRGEVSDNPGVVHRLS
jgi:hypothetical protein